MKSEPYRFYPPGVPGTTLDPQTVEALLEVNLAADLHGAIALLKQAQLKLTKYPVLPDLPGKRDELLQHVTSHLFFLEKTAANLGKAIVAREAIVDG